jgi:hypothetical protein
MVKGEVIMAVANRPLKRRRRTAQRGKPMTQSQRWGKVVTTMAPVPHGVISTSTGPVDPVEEAIIAADAEEAVEEYLPEATEEE